MNALAKSVLFFASTLMILGCSDSRRSQRELTHFVPENAFTTFRIANLQNLRSDLGNNSLLSNYDTSRPHTFFGTAQPLLAHLRTDGPSIISLVQRNDSVVDYTFATRQTANNLALDSLANKGIETLTLNGQAIQKITLGNSLAFTASIDSIFLASSSQKLLQEVLAAKSSNKQKLTKALEVTAAGELALIHQQPQIWLGDSLAVPAANQLAVQLSILPNGFRATGVALVQDTLPQLLTVFEGQLPQKNEIAEAVPLTAKKVLSFTYSNSEILLAQLAAFKGIPAIETVPSVFETVNEIGEITLPEGKAIFLKSLDTELTQAALAAQLTESGAFREVQLSTFADPTFFFQYLSPLVGTKNVRIAFQLDTFFVVAENEAVAQQIISCHTNGTCLDKAAFYAETASQLSSASSLLQLRLNDGVGAGVSQLFSPILGLAVPPTSLPKVPLFAYQFTIDRGFAHVNFGGMEAGSALGTMPGTVSESFTLQLDNDVMMPPQFFSNHRTGGHDIVVQDMANTLYLISSEGKTIWKKQLDNPILGGIEEVDILRNGNKQLAFATKHQLHVIDRTGRPVAPFPLRFSDAITQPLAVFDYDNNRNYRFVVTQDEELLMYDRKGSRISGFHFNRASSKIVLPPKHIRMGNKDYIVVAEEKGTLHILHRTGKVRVPLSTKFSFTDIPIAEEDGNFVVITQGNNKVTVTQGGKTHSQALQTEGRYGFTTLGRTKATLDDNLLRINGTLVELPFGVYSQPAIVPLGKQTVVTVTDTQENKVYLYSREATLLPGFPVYGHSQASLARSQSDGVTYMVVSGSGKEVILYHWKS
jgi:hypothetical protein